MTRWGVIVLCVLGMACALGGTPSKRVREVAEVYTTNLRWERFKEAAAAVHPDSRPEFRKLVPRGEGRIRITEYEIDSIRVAPVDGTAEAIVRYSIVRFPSVVEEQRHEVLRFRRSGGQWYVEPDLNALERDLTLAGIP
jgi:hypothetical protein